MTDLMKYVQVSQDYSSDDGRIRLKKGEVLMFLQKKNNYWCACTRDGGNNNISDPFCVPASILIEFDKLKDDDDDQEEEVEEDNEGEESPDYINIISDLDDFLNNECADDDDEDEDDAMNYVNNNLKNMHLQQQPTVEVLPQVKARKANKDYVKEHEEQERQRLVLMMNNGEQIAETPEPDYDHDYVNVENLNQLVKQAEASVGVGEVYYTDTENEASQLNNFYEEEILDSQVAVDDPYDISKEYDRNKQLVAQDELVLPANVPAGWECAEDRYKRKYYYHESDRDKQKWYVAYDEREGKPYFYNTNYESIWELPEISGTSAGAAVERRQFTEQVFDSNLRAFNQLRNLVVSKNPSDMAAASSSFQAADSSSIDASSSLKQQQGAALPATDGVKYTYKPTEQMQSTFKILRLKDRGKEIKKKTSENHLIHLASSKLLFVKQKHNKLEYHLDFKGGKCVKFENKKLQKLADGVKKKSAFMVETLDGNQVLFIHDDEMVIDKWVFAINAVIKQIQSEFSPIYERPDTLHAVNLARDKHFNPTTISTYQQNSNKKDDHENDNDYVNENMRIVVANHNNHTDDDSSNNYDNKELYCNQNQNKRVEYIAKYSSSNNGVPPAAAAATDESSKATNKLFGRKKSIEAEVKFEKKTANNNNNQQNNKFKHITDNLISFFKKRPSADQLKQRGILQECVFGSNLVNLCHKEKRYVPEFIVELIRAIESKGVDIDGLYRVNGNLSDVQKLRVQINQGKYNFQDADIHVLSGTLKTFFRELEDPLIPLRMQDRFLKALRLRDKVNVIKELINEMPVAHHETLRALGRHLLNVINSSSKNRMHLQNIALVFGPTLLRLNPIMNASNNLLNDNINAQNELIQFILHYYDELFACTDRATTTTSTFTHSSISSIGAATDGSNTMATSVTTVLSNFK